MAHPTRADARNSTSPQKPPLQLRDLIPLFPDDPFQFHDLRTQLPHQLLQLLIGRGAGHAATLPDLTGRSTQHADQSHISLTSNNSTS
jgi:hypothetical protein